MVKVTSTTEGQIVDIEGDPVEVAQMLYALRAQSIYREPRHTKAVVGKTKAKVVKSAAGNRMKFIWKKVAELKKKGLTHKQAFKKASDNWKNK